MRLLSCAQCFVASIVGHQAPCPLSRQEDWKFGLPVSPPGDLPDPGIELLSPASAGRFFLPLSYLGRPLCCRVQLLSRVRLFATPWTAERQASLSITSSQSLLKLTSIKSVMPSNHLTLCHPLLQPSIFPRIRVFSSESGLCIR